MKTPNRLILGAAVLVGLGVSACSQMSEPDHVMDESHHATTAGASQHAHDAAMMQRHSAEANQMEEHMRSHLRQMRGFAVGQQHARVGEHVNAVGQMLSMMDRHRREMDMGSGHAHMEQMMVMSAAQHEQMMKEMQALRAEVEQLQTLSGAEVGRKIPAHLDRLERMLSMLEQCADHAHHG